MVLTPAWPQHEDDPCSSSLFLPLLVLLLKKVKNPTIEGEKRKREERRSESIQTRGERTVPTTGRHAGPSHNFHDGLLEHVSSYRRSYMYGETQGQSSVQVGDSQQSP